MAHTYPHVLTSARRTSALVLAATLLFLGCTENQAKDPPPRNDFGAWDSAGYDTSVTPDVVDDSISDLSTDGLTDSVSGDTDLDADVVPSVPGPVIEIIEPVEATDFSSDTLITKARFSVTCKVTAHPDGMRLDKESVLITVTNEKGTVYEQVGQPTVAAEQYAADFFLPDAENGPLTLGCAAQDIADPPHSAAATVDTFIDLGPVITILNPGSGLSYSNQLQVYFRVETSPVSKDDPLAGVAQGSVKAFIGTVEIPGLTLDSFGNFVTTFEFDDPTLFDLPLEGLATLKVQATNSRTSVPVTREIGVVFNADSKGAKIEILHPEAGQLVGGIFHVRVKVTDPAGVDPTSVVATVVSQELSLAPVGADEYEGLFDGRNLPASIAFPLLVVRAKDAVGNQASVGQAIALDITPPLPDLDSDMVREVNEDGECSAIFDPLGDDAVNYGQRVHQIIEFRARIEDDGNGRSSNSSYVLPYAGVNPASTKLYLLDDSANALIVDTDGDGICDEINPLLTPTSVPMTSMEAAVINLAPIDPAGESHFTSNLVINPPAWWVADPDFGTQPFDFDFLCARGKANPFEPPDPICDVSSPLIRVMKDKLEAVAVIWAPAPTSSFACLGRPVDAIGSNLSDGWACAAVRAEDNLGNIGISAIIPICIDSDDNGDNGCDVEYPSNPPDCTGVYDQVTNTVVSGSSCATPPRFPNMLRRTY